MAKAGSEADLTAKFRKEVEAFGGRLITISGGRGVVGQPDRMLYHAWWRGLIEIKVKRNKLSAIQKLQVAVLRRINPAGCVVVRLFPGEPGAMLYGEIENENGEVISAFTGARVFIVLMREMEERFNSSKPSKL